MNNGSGFDFIIIGSGAGGGTLACKLAPSGAKILLIERGPFVRREKENWSSLEVNARGRYNTKERWRNADGTELQPHTNYYVGGNTKFYGAALFRLREEDFREIKHHGGISPAWPISYYELEPYYTEAERIYHVHGEVGEDPTDPLLSQREFESVTSTTPFPPELIPIKLRWLQTTPPGRISIRPAVVVPTTMSPKVPPEGGNGRPPRIFSPGTVVEPLSTSSTPLLKNFSSVACTYPPF